MKNRLLCIGAAVLLALSAACSQAEIKNENEGINEVYISSGYTASSLPDFVVEEDYNTVKGDMNKGTDSVKETYVTALSADESDNEEKLNNPISVNTDTEIVKETEEVSEPSEDDFSTDIIAEEEKADIEDYVIIEIYGEYVCIKSSVVRSGPSTDFDKLGQIQNDEVVYVTGMSDNGWYRFEFESSDGFANQKFFEDKESYDEELAIVNDEEYEEVTEETPDLNEEASDEENSDEETLEVELHRALLYTE